MLEWTRLVLDAHLTRLLLAQELPPSLERLVQLTQHQVGGRGRHWRAWARLSAHSLHTGALGWVRTFAVMT